jgi:hypothetical protein
MADSVRVEQKNQHAVYMLASGNPNDRYTAGNDLPESEKKVVLEELSEWNSHQRPMNVYLESKIPLYLQGRLVDPSFFDA